MHCGDTVALLLRSRDKRPTRRGKKRRKPAALPLETRNAIYYSLLKKLLQDWKCYDSILSREISNLWAAKWWSWKGKGG